MEGEITRLRFWDLPWQTFGLRLVARLAFGYPNPFLRAARPEVNGGGLATAASSSVPGLTSLVGVACPAGHIREQARAAVGTKPALHRGIPSLTRRACLRPGNLDVTGIRGHPRPASPSKRTQGHPWSIAASRVRRSPKCSPQLKPARVDHPENRHRGPFHRYF